MAMNIKDTPYFALYGEIYRLHGKYLEPVADDSFLECFNAGCRYALQEI